MVQLNGSSRNLQIKATFEGRTWERRELVHEQKAYSLILTFDGMNMAFTLVRWRLG